MQKPPAPEPLAKFRANCCPPDELVKLSKDVGSCTVESKMPTNLRVNKWKMTEDSSVFQRTAPGGMLRVQSDEAPAERELAPVTHGIHIVVCHER
jgi:hypothetical protein